MTTNVTSLALSRVISIALIAIGVTGCGNDARPRGAGTDGGPGRDGAAAVPACWDVSGAYELSGDMNPGGCPPSLSCAVTQRGCEIEVSCGGLSFTEEIACGATGSCTLSGTASISGVSISVTGTFEVPVTGGVQTGAPTRASVESTSPDGLVCRYQTAGSGSGGCACDASSGCEAGCACDDDCGGGGGMCTDTCASAHDGECDDGGPGSLYDVCAYGTDCADCGARAAGSCSCSGRECGDDGCGGSCGACSAGESCNASGQCVGTAPTCACDGGALTCDIGCDCDPDCEGNASCRVDSGSFCSPGSTSPSDCCEPGMVCTCPRGSGSSCSFAVCMAALNSSCSSDLACRDGTECVSGYCR